MFLQLKCWDAEERPPVISTQRLEIFSADPPQPSCSAVWRKARGSWSSGRVNGSRRVACYHSCDRVWRIGLLSHEGRRSRGINSWDFQVDGNDSDRAGQDRTGQGRTGQGRAAQVRAGQIVFDDASCFLRIVADSAETRGERRRA